MKDNTRAHVSASSSGRTLLRTFLVVVMATAILPIVMSEQLLAQQQCRTVDDATLTAQINPACGDSPAGLCAQATITGGGLDGQYSYVVDEASPGAGLASLPPSTLSATGTFMYTSTQGEQFQGRKYGLFDTATGNVAFIYDVNDPVANVTATFFAVGVVNLSDFSVNPSPFGGVICIGG